MIQVRYNNKILTPQERIEYKQKADEYIANLSRWIDGMASLLEEIKTSTSHTDTDTSSRYTMALGSILKAGLFTTIALTDCIVFTKLFVLADNLYEKQLLRGKIRVLLNEGFKRLCGFEWKNRKSSYIGEIESVLSFFPGNDEEFLSICKDIDEISKVDSWWKEERNVEVHMDTVTLYKMRQEEINESKVVMETMRLVRVINRINAFMAKMVGRNILNSTKKSVVVR